MTGIQKRRRVVTAAVFGALLLVGSQGCARSRPAPAAANPGAVTLKAFADAVAAYHALHEKAEAGLTPLRRDATPEQLGAYEEALGRRIRELRADATQGQIFTPAVQEEFRFLIATALEGRGAAMTRAAILETEVPQPGTVPLEVNARYPGDVVLVTMPPELLLKLPKLPESLEYRIVGRALVLRDTHAALVVDFMPRAVPQLGPA